MKNDTEYIIEAPRGFPRINWQELWRYRDLFLVLAWRDIAVRYKQTVLGVIWAILQPVLTMIVFTFVFNRMAGIGSGDKTPYPLFLYVGQLFWQYFSSTLSTASQSMIANASLIQKIYFPRLIVPATAATTGLVDFGIGCVVLAVMMLHYAVVPNLLLLVAVPVLVATSVLCSLGIGMFMAAVNLKYRDVRYALPFFVQTMMYVTPVIYPVSMLDRHPLVKSLMLWLNPMTGVIVNARAVLLGSTAVDPRTMAISLGMSSLFFVLGLYYFRNTERYFADIA